MCLDNDRCTQVQYAGKSMVYVPTKTIIHLMTLVLVDYSRLWIKLKLNCIIEKPENHWSCINHLSAEDKLKSAVIEET